MQVFKATVVVVTKIIGQDVHDGKIILNPAIVKYLERDDMPITVAQKTLAEQYQWSNFRILMLVSKNLCDCCVRMVQYCAEVSTCLCDMLQRQQKYYLKDWVSSKIPALDNKTPLQAVKTKEGRLQLEALINRMEGMDNAQPDYLPKMDMNFLRQKLGLPLAARG